MKKWLWLPLNPCHLVNSVHTGIYFDSRPIYTRFCLHYEYGLKNFPPDEYGFSTEERLHWGNPIHRLPCSIQKESNSLRICDLTDGNPIYNERELSHMKDVKNPGSSSA